MKTVEDFAGQFVSLYTAGPGGSYGVRLTVPGQTSVVIGRTANPAVAREWVLAVRCYMAAAVRQLNSKGEVVEVTDEFLTHMIEAPTGESEGRLVGLPS
jgi:hypothetical protein